MVFKDTKQWHFDDMAIQRNETMKQQAQQRQTPPPYIHFFVLSSNVSGV